MRYTLLPRTYYVLRSKTVGILSLRNEVILAPRFFCVFSLFRENIYAAKFKHIVVNRIVLLRLSLYFFTYEIISVYYFFGSAYLTEKCLKGPNDFFVFY